MSLRDVGHELVSNPKVAHAIATGTAGSGIGTMFNLIPDDIGKVATLIGIVLSVVLIFVHTRKAISNWKIDKVNLSKSELELEILQEQHRILVKQRKEGAE